MPLLGNLFYSPVSLLRSAYNKIRKCIGQVLKALIYACYKPFGDVLLSVLGANGWEQTLWYVMLWYAAAVATCVTNVIVWNVELDYNDFIGIVALKLYSLAWVKIIGIQHWDLMLSNFQTTSRDRFLELATNHEWCLQFSDCVVAYLPPEYQFEVHMTVPFTNQL